MDPRVRSLMARYPVEPPADRYEDEWLRQNPSVAGYATGNDPETKHSSVVLKDRKSTRLNSSHVSESRMPSSA